MSNSFWNFLTSLVPGTLARAEDVNNNLSGVAAGFDAVEVITDQAVKLTNSPGTVAIVLNAAARANKLLEFDANGDIAATTIMGDWKGAHANAAGTDYQIRDVVKDSAGALGLNNLYICVATHTSTGDLLADTASWELLIDATIGNAASVNIADAGGLIAATEVEGALQELAYANVVANHIRGGNKQLWNGAAGTTLLNIVASVAEATWESIGPTGSGADNVWAQMDALPASATILIVDIEVAASSSASFASGSDNVELFVSYGDDATPSDFGSTNQVIKHKIEATAARVGNDERIYRVEIPLGPTNQDFIVYWEKGTCDLYGIDFYYRGFITD